MVSKAESSPVERSARGGLETELVVVESIPPEDEQQHHNEQAENEHIKIADETAVTSGKLNGIWTLQEPLMRHKLYCRDREYEQLLEAYKKVKTASRGGDGRTGTHLVFYKGCTGVGKTTLAQSLRPVVQRDGGYFVQGTFDARRPEPHAVLISAFGEFAEAVVQRGDDEVARIRQQVFRGIDEVERKILVDIIPPLEKILGAGQGPRAHQREEGEQPATRLAEDDSGTSLGRTPPEAGYTEAIHRFKRAVLKLVRVISSPEKPFVCLLDDWHWADESSIDLLRYSVVPDKESLGVLFLFTYRDNYDNSKKHLVDVLPIPSSASREVTVARLGNLTKDDVGVLLSQVMGVDREAIENLAEFVYAQTDGNFLSIVEQIQALSDGGFLQYKDGRLHWDMDEIRIELGESDLLLQKITELPEPSKELLKIASCLGSRLDFRLLINFASGPDLDDFLRQTEKEGLVTFDQRHDSWVLKHDRVREIVYDEWMSTDERERLHYRIGRRLWRAFDLATIDRSIFVVVGQLMMAQNLMTSEKERVAVAKLCLRAGEQAVALSNFHTAHTYLMQGIDLLGARAWRDEFDLTLRLHNAATEISYCVGKLDMVHALVEDVLQNARCFDDAFRVQTVKIYALGSSGQPRLAIETSFDLLKKLGEPFPAKPTLFHVLFAKRRTMRRLRRKTSESILRLPIMDDSQKVAAMQVLQQSFIYAFMANGDRLMALIGLRMVDLTLKYGINPASCLGLCVVASAMCATGAVDEGYRYGRLAVAFQEKFHLRSYLARFQSLYFEGVLCWKEPFQSGLPSLTEAAEVGLDVGDVEFGFMCFAYAWVCRFYITPLRELENEIQDMSRRMEFTGQRITLMSIRPLWQSAHNLMGLDEGDPKKLIGAVFDETDVTAHIETDIQFVHAAMCFPRMMLCYLFGDFYEAAEVAKGTRAISSSHYSPLLCSDILLFDALTVVAVARKVGRRRARRARSISSLLRKWALNAPLNYLGLHFLIDAEIASLASNDASALSNYTAAIAMFEKTGFIFHIALANELCGKFLLRRGDLEPAESHLRAAILSYNQWNAVIKARHLRDEVECYKFYSLKSLV